MDEYSAHAAILSIPKSYPQLMYGIARTKRALNAWCWRVNFRRRNKLYAKQFFDLKHGGSKPALEAAIAWRDRTLALVAALVEARIEGRYPDAEWRR